MLASITEAVINEKLIENYIEMLYQLVKNVLIISVIPSLINSTCFSKDILFKVFLHSEKQVRLYKILEL